MIRRLVWQDLAWAGIIFVVAVALGVQHQWSLVRLSFKGSLPAYLKVQQERRIRERAQGVRTLNLDQTHEIFQKRLALFVDARNPEEYRELHIPGAVNLSPERLDREGARALGGIPADRRMVVYCGMSDCEASLKVAEKLQSLGFTGVEVFLGGFRAWDEAGYPADTSN